MVLAGFALFAGVVSGLISRGRFSNLADIPMRYSALVLAWLAGIIFADPIGRWIGGSGGNNLGFGVYLIGLAALVVFAVINAVHMPGMWLIALGALANLVVCANNHGTPYSISALHNAGVTAVNYTDVATSTATKHPERPGDQLKFLGDVVPIRVLKTVVSPGDLLFAFGLASVTANGLSGRRGGRRVRGVHRGRHLPKGEVPGGLPILVPATHSGVLDPSDPVSATSTLSADLGESPSAERGRAAQDLSRVRTLQDLSRVRTLQDLSRVRTLQDLSRVRTDGSLGSLLAGGRSAIEGVGVDGFGDDGFGSPTTAEGVGGSATSGGPTAWTARLDLLRATGDPEVLIDVTGGVAGPDDVTPAHALALALRAQHIPDDHVARLVSAAVSSSASAGQFPASVSSSVSASAGSRGSAGVGSVDAPAGLVVDGVDGVDGGASTSDPSFQSINRIDLLELLSEV